MREQSELLGLIKTALEEVLEKPLEVSANTRLRADLSIESIDVIDFIFVLEKLTGARLEIEDFFQYLAQRPNALSRDIVVTDLLGFLELKLRQKP